jgi:hypothetical protein
LIFDLTMSFVLMPEIEVYAGDEIVNIPDPILEQGLRRCLSKYEGNITKADILITHLGPQTL